jgi:hypothetical protein
MKTPLPPEQAAGSSAGESRIRPDAGGFQTLRPGLRVENSFDFQNRTCRR